MIFSTVDCQLEVASGALTSGLLLSEWNADYTPYLASVMKSVIKITKKGSVACDWRITLEPAFLCLAFFPPVATELLQFISYRTSHSALHMQLISDTFTSTYRPEKNGADSAKMQPWGSLQ